MVVFGKAALFPATPCDIAIRDASSHDEAHRNNAWRLRSLVNAIRMAFGTDAISDSLSRGAKRALPVFVGVLRVTIYAVLAVLRPVIVAALSGVTLVGLALCLFFATLVPGSHFPTGLVLILSVASASLIVVFYAVMEGLLPQ